MKTEFNDPCWTLPWVCEGFPRPLPRVDGRHHAERAEAESACARTGRSLSACCPSLTSLTLAGHAMIQDR